MKRARTLRTIRVYSSARHSLVRTRTSGKRKSRRRPTPRKLPKKLALIRERLGFSQSEITARLGVKDRASISGYERGEREPPLPVLLAYARLAGVSVESLIDDKLEIVGQEDSPT
jgi:DNA-binding XRE family transcriptional regulator